MLRLIASSLASIVLAVAPGCVAQCGDPAPGSAEDLARQRQPVRRNLVIKTIKPDANDARARARLNAEVRALAATDHPNVVTLLDATQAAKPASASRRTT